MYSFEVSSAITSIDLSQLLWIQFFTMQLSLYLLYLLSCICPRSCIFKKYYYHRFLLPSLTYITKDCLSVSTSSGCACRNVNTMAWDCEVPNMWVTIATARPGWGARSSWNPTLARSLLPAVLLPVDFVLGFGLTDLCFLLLEADVEESGESSVVRCWHVSKVMQKNNVHMFWPIYNWIFTYISHEN